ncbi:Propionate kinase [Caballeronia sp. SBC1]|uniref:acetate/propionate family kinase n=1 Tax=Caballeronia sp. SBC1 TaxID=2705548 RepID=UPI00140F3529|nr:acetate kinase [Caballeronia sp. SBC1]QIN63495.1 Propionate kinase [Caballeronia sp. SBC1]
MSISQFLILVINSGSSSLKFTLLPANGDRPLFSGIAERLGTDGTASLTLKRGASTFIEPLAEGTHAQALQMILMHLRRNGWLAHVAVVGHRVVHGGERFATSVRITPEVIRDIEAVSALAPLHNTANLLGILCCMEDLPSIPQVAVFDTAFHQTLPRGAYTYSIPQRFYREHGIRRYGFHGTSIRYVSAKAVKLLGLDPDDHGLVIAHLGNGASASSVEDGKCVDTSMGMTPLEGLVMGTRSGDLDVGAAAQIGRIAGLDLAGVEMLLNRESGLLGVSELSSDCRALETAAEAGHPGATLALEVFVHRLARYVGALATSLRRLDAVVFTGGIGENSARVRAMTLRHLGIFNLVLDESANQYAVRGMSGRIDQGYGPRRGSSRPTRKR